MCGDPCNERPRLYQTRIVYTLKGPVVTWTDNDPILVWKDPNLKNRARRALAEQNKKTERQSWRLKRRGK